MAARQNETQNRDTKLHWRNVPVGLKSSGLERRYHFCNYHKYDLAYEPLGDVPASYPLH